MNKIPKKPRALRGRGGGYTALAHQYDAFTKNMDYKKRTEYLCALLCDAGCSGGLLLDLACGTGTYTYALLRRGYDVIGVDASEDMLQIAREKADELHVSPPLLLSQRLEELDLYGTAQGAVCLTDSLNHLTDESRVRRFFARLALFLEPGAPFIFDVNTQHKHAHVLGDNTFIYEEDGVFCAWQNTWDARRQTTEIALDIFTKKQDGSYDRRRDCFAERCYAPEDLTRWLEQAGFVAEHIYEELTTHAPCDTAQRIFFVCRRV